VAIKAAARSSAVAAGHLRGRIGILSNLSQSGLRRKPERDSGRARKRENTLPAPAKQDGKPLSSNRKYSLACPRVFRYIFAKSALRVSGPPELNPGSGRRRRTGVMRREQ